MDLLVVSQYFYPEQFRINDVCSHLKARGHNVTVLTGLPNYPAGKIFSGYEWRNLKSQAGKKHTDDNRYDSFLDAYIERINDVEVIRCKIVPRMSGKFNLLRNYLSFAFQAVRVANAMIKKQYKFDKVIIFQYSPVTMAAPGIVFKKKLKLPLILYCFDLWPESIVSGGLPNHGLIYNLVSKVSRWIYKKADKILISSRSFIKYFNNNLDIHGNIVYLPIYAEDLFFYNEKSTVQNNTLKVESKDTINLVFAGNIGEMQSVDTIVKAAELLKEHKNIRFHIVGDGSALNRNKKLASELLLDNISFHGRHPLEKMPEFYSLADAFLVTLKSNEFISYTLPNKVQSYMAAGKPIIASINGETADVVLDSGCGLCCEAENYHDLAELILRFYKENEKHHIYGANAFKYYQENFSSEKFMDRLEGILYN